jgi:uncharacterized membrane protein
MDQCKAQIDMNVKFTSKMLEIHFLFSLGFSLVHEFVDVCFIIMLEVHFLFSLGFSLVHLLSTAGAQLTWEVEISVV